MKKSLPPVTLRERHKQPLQSRVILDIMSVFAHHAHNLHVVSRAVFRRLGETNVLSEGISIWENFPGQFFVDNCHPAPVLVFALRLIKIAAAQ